MEVIVPSFGTVPALSRISIGKLRSISTQPLHYYDDLSAFGSSIVLCWLDYLSGTRLAVYFH